MYRHSRPTAADSLRHWRHLIACLPLSAAWLAAGYLLPRWLWPDGGGAAFALTANLVFFALSGMLIFHLRASLKAAAEERALLDRDVGAFRQAEEKLRESERRWQFALEGAEQGVWDLDLVTGKPYYSPRWHAMLGYVAEDAIDERDWRALVHPEDLPGAMQELRRHFRGETDLVRCEYRMRRSNGDYLWVLTRGRISERDAQGRPTRITGTNTDISRRKAMERALQTREQVQRDLMDALPLGMYQMGRDGRVIFANRYMLRTFGVDSEDACVGKDMYDLIPDADDVAKARAWDQEVMEDGTPQFRVEEYLLPGSGQRRHIEVGRIPYRNSAGDVVGLHGFFRDITEQVRAEQALRASERLYRSLGDALPMGLFRLDREGRIVFGNQFMAQSLGVKNERDFLGKNMFQMTPERDRDHSYRQYRRVIDEGKTWTTIEEHLLPGVEGSHYLEITRIPVRDESGEIVGEQGTFRDVTEQVRAEQELRMTSLVFASTHQAVLIADAQGQVLKVNQAFSRITGYAPEDVLGRTQDFMRSGLYDEQVYARIHALVCADGHWEGELWGRRKNGDTYPMFITLDALRGEDGEICNFVTMYMDISERKASEERINHLARHDQLTDLPNRSLLRDRVDAAIDISNRSGKPFALMFLDLDRFKQINDSLGHAFGDQLLRETGRRLKDTVRATDTVSRHGGDEFIVLLPDAGSEDDIRTISRKLIREIGRPFVIDGKEVILTLSVGISMYPGDGKDIDTLLRNADTALYATKAAGRNHYRFYSDEMNTRAEQRLQTENELRYAVERGELFLEYQPQLDLASREVVGIEALVRWRHPQRGIVSPGEFIPIAEDSGLIVELGTWVMEAACRQHANWLSSGLMVGHVSVNVSGHQFRHRAFVAMVLGCLERSGLEAPWLELELTETVIMQAAEQMVTRLEQLAEVGVRMSVDDFGTGYSSLSYLKHFPIDRLKIDQSFVRDLPHDASDAAIVRAVVGLGRNLELDVLAEGIETQEQLDFLQALGCHAGQGYLFARPMSADDCEHFMRAQMARKSLKAVSRA